MVAVTPASNLQALVTANPAGTVFNFAPGIYRGQQVTTPKNNIQFLGNPIGSPGGRTILRGSEVIGGWVLTPGTGEVSVGTWASVKTFTRLTPSSDVATYTGTSLAQFSEEVFVDGVRFTPTLTNPPPAGHWFWSSGKIILPINPVGRLVEIAQTQGFFTGGNGLSGEIMTDLIIEHYASPVQSGVQGTVVAGPNGTYTRCTIQDNHGVAFNTFNTGVTMTDCKLLRNGNCGYSGAVTPDNFTMTGTETAYNMVADFNALNNGGAGKWFNNNTTASNILRCYAHHNYGLGFWADFCQKAVNHRHNLSVENYHNGIMIELGTGGSPNGLVEFNVCLRNGISHDPTNTPYPSQIHVFNASNYTYNRNYLESSPNGGNILGMVQDNNRAGNDSNNNTFSNNTVVMSDAVSQVGFWNYNASGGTGAGYTETVTNNDYFCPSTTDTHFTWWDNTHITFATWQTTRLKDTSASGSTITAATWPPMVVLASNYANATEVEGTSLINTTDAPSALWGGITGQIFDPGPYAWPHHVWMGKGTNTLIIRIGAGQGAGDIGTIVHDWTTGGGTNNIVVLGYSFANAAAVVAACATSGANVVLTLTDGKTVTFTDAAVGSFTTANMAIALPAIPDVMRTAAYLLANDFQTGQSQAISSARLRELTVSALASGTGPPTSGTYSSGAFMLNSADPLPILGAVGSRYYVHGWRCSVSGTPGTWVPMVVRVE